MTIEEILAAEIPEGKYKNAMLVLKIELRVQLRKKQSLITPSLCAALSALMTLAKEPNGYFYPICEPNQFRSDERRLIISDVMKLVDEMNQEIILSITGQTIGLNEGVDASKATLKELKRRIAALSKSKEVKL